VAGAPSYVYVAAVPSWPAASNVNGPALLCSAFCNGILAQLSLLSIIDGLYHPPNSIFSSPLSPFTLSLGCALFNTHEPNVDICRMHAVRDAAVSWCINSPPHFPLWPPTSLSNPLAGHIRYMSMRLTRNETAETPLSMATRPAPTETESAATRSHAAPVASHDSLSDSVESEPVYDMANHPSRTVPRPRRPELSRCERDTAVIHTTTVPSLTATHLLMSDTDVFHAKHLHELAKWPRFAGPRYSVMMRRNGRETLPRAGFETPASSHNAEYDVVPDSPEYDTAAVMARLGATTRAPEADEYDTGSEV